jgi:hypothetical protein
MWSYVGLTAARVGSWLAQNGKARARRLALRRGRTPGRPPRHHSARLIGSGRAPYPAPVRTRTLLLLAVACGLVILVAGVVQLLRIAGQDEPAPAAQIGEPVRVGDLTVTVDSYSERDDRGVVELSLGGVEDPAGTADFRLVVPGASLSANGSGSDACAGTTVAQRACSLTFDLGGTEGSSRVLLYRRGDERARWILASA